eukprot:4552896-Pyramimonas_sp.AAC.1
MLFDSSNDHLDLRSRWRAGTISNSTGKILESSNECSTGAGGKPSTLVFAFAWSHGETVLTSRLRATHAYEA